MATQPNTAFGEFLRSRRERLTPKAAGFSEARTRRTTGLRRQEVAELAGIGVDWYIRLEQGRAVTPSSMTIDALARALQLTRTEHAHLRVLAQSGQRAPFVRENVPDGLRRLLDSLQQPAYVTGLRWDVLAWNKAAADLFPAFDRLLKEGVNVLLYMFTVPEARALFGEGWAKEARRMLAQFHTTHDLWAADPAFVSLVERLRVESDEFARWWKAHDVHAGSAGRKLLHHPRKGVSAFEYATFQVSDDQRLKLAIYTRV